MAITANIGGTEAGGAANGGMDWQIQYDDQTRAVTAQASGSGKCRVLVQVTDALSPVVGFEADGLSVPDADFHVPTDGQPHVLATNVNANRVRRLVAKADDQGGLQFESTWSRH